MTSETHPDKYLDHKLSEWLSWDKNEKTHAKIKELVKNGCWEELKTRLLNRMEFGTAGLRARMGAGYNMMNDLSIIQATQGLCRYMLSSIPEAKSMGVTIGYDGRHNSHRFALLTANIFLRQDVKVYLFSEMVPTPYVAYCTRINKCACGVMVTASHNPKEDNGYKVYWSNGAQIISPVDKGISKNIGDNLEPWPTSWDIDEVESHPLRVDPYQDIYKRYNDDVKKLCYFREANEKSPVKFTYTAMHGVGYPFTDEAVKQFGFTPVIPVPEQVKPDPEFPTVKYPNPEEGKGALTLSFRTADAHGSQVILANDPDADRLALAETNGDEWTIFSGNETGALLGWWSWLAFRQKYPDVPASGCYKVSMGAKIRNRYNQVPHMTNDTNGKVTNSQLDTTNESQEVSPFPAVSDCYMMSSTVSSKILETMAMKEGFNFEETLTGFKWMGNRADTLINEGRTVLFAFEEAIGFMCGSCVLDKDGVSAAAMCAEMATYIYNQGMTIQQQLEKIYQQYGFHISSNSYYICHDPSTIKQMFEEIRNYKDKGQYPESCGAYRIKYIRDLTAGYDNSRPDNNPVLPVSKSSQMITFTFENGCVATLRTSGTEPKIKYYTEHKPGPKQGLDKEGARQELEDMVDCIKKHFFQPDKFGLKPRTES